VAASDVLAIIAQFKAALRKRDAQQMAIMAKRWLGVVETTRDEDFC
jgi:hypothetical protein